MSSILKALKKLEHENSGHVPELLTIDSDILRSSRSSRSISLLSLGLLLLLFFGGGATVAYLFMMKARVSPSVTKPQAEILSKSSSPLVTGKTIPVQAVIVPAHTKRSDAVADKVADSIVKNAAPASVASVSENPQGATISAANKINSASAPTLRVNGIAFQNGGTDNMAIVNGMPVSNGSIIEGATVKEVQQDRILFQYNGERFEIQLGQSNR